MAQLASYPGSFRGREKSLVHTVCACAQSRQNSVGIGYFCNNVRIFMTSRHASIIITSRQRATPAVEPWSGLWFTLSREWDALLYPSNMSICDMPHKSVCLLNPNYAHAHAVCTRLFSLPRKEPGYQASGTTGCGWYLILPTTLKFHQKSIWLQFQETRVNEVCKLRVKQLDVTHSPFYW